MVNAKPARKPRAAKPIGYSPSGMCKGCHVDIHKQQSGSMHALSYENPVFQAQYYKEALPRAYGERRYRDEARSCAACHMPVAYATSAAPVIIGKHIDPRMSGVTCDLCHRISGYKGDAPGNGNYIASPGPEKYGPFRHHKPWHHVYLELQTKSEFCAICHNSTNQLGVEVKPTYTEWKASPHARNGIQCQDCHMNADGYLIDSEARYESGKAAVMVVGSAPERKKLYTHRFPGAKTQTHIENALPLRISTEKSRVAQGEALTITVQVSNERTGHRMPSGSIELRYLWLDLRARIGDRSFDIPASSVTAPLLYDVGGAMPGDQAALGEGFPPGKRVYRAIFLDENCKQTHSMIEAASKVFDNRLETAAVRTETFAWRVPDDIEGTVEIVARLHYVAYPESFATRLELPRAPTTLISASQHTVTVVPAR
ncbi:NapC/NirT family cytochrome c [bacterium]|nr:NapC/NirT family cytochrome c [bacterium]